MPEYSFLRVEIEKSRILGCNPEISLAVRTDPPDSPAFKTSFFVSVLEFVEVRGSLREIVDPSEEGAYPDSSVPVLAKGVDCIVREGPLIVRG